MNNVINLTAMKYNFLFFSLLFAINISFSQVNLGVIAEAGKGSLVYDYHADLRLYSNFYYDLGANWLAGVYAEYYTPSGFNVQLDVVYNQINYLEGFQIRDMRNNEFVFIVDEKNKIKIECISLPIVFGYKYKRFNFGLGAQYSMFFKKTNSYENYYIYKAPISGSSSTPWKYYNYDLGLTSFISYQIFDRISVEARFNRGLRNVPDNRSLYETTYSQQFLFGVKCDIVQLKRETGKSFNYNSKQKQLIGSRVIEKKQMFEEEEEEF